MGSTPQDNQFKEFAPTPLTTAQPSAWAQEEQGSANPPHGYDPARIPGTVEPISSPVSGEDPPSPIDSPTAKHLDGKVAAAPIQDDAASREDEFDAGLFFAIRVSEFIRAWFPSTNLAGLSNSAMERFHLVGADLADQQRFFASAFATDGVATDHTFDPTGTCVDTAPGLLPAPTGENIEKNGSDNDGHDLSPRLTAKRPDPVRDAHFEAGLALALRVENALLDWADWSQDVLRSLFPATAACYYADSSDVPPSETLALPASTAEHGSEPGDIVEAMESAEGFAPQATATAADIQDAAEPVDANEAGESGNDGFAAFLAATIGPRLLSRLPPASDEEEPSDRSWACSAGAQDLQTADVAGPAAHLSQSSEWNLVDIFSSTVSYEMRQTYGSSEDANSRNCAEGVVHLADLNLLSEKTEGGYLTTVVDPYLLLLSAQRQPQEPPRLPAASANSLYPDSDDSDASESLEAEITGRAPEFEDHGGMV